jgi:hypothetical protein
MRVRLSLTLDVLMFGVPAFDLVLAARAPTVFPPPSGEGR